MPTALLMGLDEAGRGCVIGPLFLAAFAIAEEDYLIDKLNSLGVKDSKLLLSKKRDELAKEIKKIAHYHKIAKINPRLIDDFSINDLEIKFSARLVNKFPSVKVYVDVPASGAGVKRYCGAVASLCSNRSEFIGGNKMDNTNVLVAAASILAKSARERHLAVLKKKYGDFGSGYPADPVTVNWLKNWQKTKRQWPSIVRRKWGTLERI